jgi:hypothetical protein
MKKKYAVLQSGGKNMTKFETKAFSTPDLLRHFANILDELKQRGVVRTRNNPVADYAEWMVAQRLDLSLERNSKSGYDAINTSGERFQIKSRRLDPSNNSRQLSVIRNLHAGEFDYLIGILFDRDFTVNKAYKIPHSVIAKYARFSKHQNGHIFHLRGDILRDPGVEDITHVFSNDRATDAQHGLCGSLRSPKCFALRKARKRWATLREKAQ